MSDTVKCPFCKADNERTRSSIVKCVSCHGRFESIPLVPFFHHLNPLAKYAVFNPVKDSWISAYWNVNGRASHLSWEDRKYYACGFDKRQLKKMLDPESKFRNPEEFLGKLKDKTSDVVYRANSMTFLCSVPTDGHYYVSGASIEYFDKKQSLELKLVDLLFVRMGSYEHKYFETLSMHGFKPIFKVRPEID